MKKTLSLFVVCLWTLSSGTSLADFGDTQYSWYRDSILELQTQGFANGYGDGNFGPNNSITRAELLKLLLLTSKITLPEVSTEERCFPDVDPSVWYHSFICAAHKLGIANGFEDGTFKPNNPVTTLESIAFGLKAFGIDPGTSTDDTWYEAFRRFADTNHLLPIHSYTLSSQVSRGKSADFIVRLGKYKANPSPLSYGSTGCQTFGTLGAENTITVANKERKYNLSLPNNYTNSRQYALVVATHGRTNSKDQVQRYMGLDKQSDFIVAYPAALPSTSGSSFSWSEAENMTFIDAMLREVSENYCINRNEIYLIGHSLGGWMAQKIACLRGEFVKSAAVVGSGGYVGNCTGPVGTLFFQNPDDALSSYESGKAAEKIRKEVNQCGEETEDVQIGSLTCKRYTKCASGNPVVWCEGYQTYGNDPHSWPLSGGSWMLSYYKTMF